MSVQEFQANSTVMPLKDRDRTNTQRRSPYRITMKADLRTNRKLRMGDVVELTPALPRESLTNYREEIQRMYDRGGFALATRGGSSRR